ncbi:MAG: transglycosylase SLT domain-containing protein [Chitinophagaceae bacterium]|nr:transglycosylase SLT domain-containing protein [Chitinophagaceae bacterium]
MAALEVPIPMTPRVFYSNAALPQNKAKLDQIGKKYYKEIKQAEELTKVPGALILSVIFTESAGNPSVVSYVGAAGLMQLKPQAANDTIYLENKQGRLTAGELAVLKKYLGNRINGPLKQKYLSHKINENNYTGNVVTRADMLNPEFNILCGAMLLGILIDQHQEAGLLRLDKVLLRYGMGYFYKPGEGTIEQVLDRVKPKSSEGYAYILKVLGKNGLLETQAV